MPGSTAIFHLNFSTAITQQSIATRFLKQCLHQFTPSSRVYLLTNLNYFPHLRNATKMWNPITKKSYNFMINFYHFGYVTDIFLSSVFSIFHVVFSTTPMKVGAHLKAKQKEFSLHPTLDIRSMSLHHEILWSHTLYIPRPPGGYFYKFKFFPYKTYITWFTIKFLFNYSTNAYIGIYYYVICF